MTCPGLTASQIDDWIRRLYLREVPVFLPAFKARYKKNLTPTLRAMGMPLALDPGRADFPGIRDLTPEKNLYVSDVIHEAFVQADEEGTEAAAATAVVMVLVSLSFDGPPVSRADRPFLFLIRRPIGTILFPGRLSDPRSI